MIRRPFPKLLYPEQPQTVFCSLPYFSFRQSHLNRSKRNLFLYTSTKQLRIRILKHISHLLMEPFCKLSVLQSFFRNLMVLVKITSFGWKYNSIQQLDKRRFSTSIRSLNDQRITLFNMKINISERHLMLISVAHFLQIDHIYLLSITSITQLFYSDK